MGRVRCKKMTRAAYDALAIKDPAVLYFVNTTGDFSPESMDTEGDIYLGCKLLTHQYATPVFTGSDDAHVGTPGLVPGPQPQPLGHPLLLTSQRQQVGGPWMLPDDAGIATKTYVDNLVGGIETLLAAI